MDHLSLMSLSEPSKKSIEKKKSKTEKVNYGMKTFVPSSMEI
jgi:hypothetical protein